jgi:diaminopimelate epimerase
MNSPSGSALPFTKASACGNDFLIVEASAASGDLSSLTRRLCDRHNGVGADGVEWLFPGHEADTRIQLFNADGSEAEISGNGTRCVAAFLCSRIEKPEFVIQTGAGRKSCRLIGHQGSTYEFAADMGVPSIEQELAIETMWVRAVGRKVSMGNPHFVIFVDTFPQDWQRQGAVIASQPVFPQGTNIEYVVVRGPNEIEIRLYERGVGETQSSGTGSCASAVAAIASRRVSSPLKVVAPGGVQTVRWEDRVDLQGPATLICRGEFFI